MEVVKDNQKEAPSMEEMQKMYDELQKKKEECWKEIIPILEKYNFVFTSMVNITDRAQVKFLVDLAEKQPAQPQA